PALQNELSTAARELQAVTALLALEREGRQAAERRAEALVHDLERQRERARRALSSVEAFRRELYELRHATRASQGPPETGDLARRPGAGAESTIARPAESPVARPAEPAIARPAESTIARPAEPPAARRDE